MNPSSQLFDKSSGDQLIAQLIFGGYRRKLRFVSQCHEASGNFGVIQA
jgi:hypothetical protein